MLLLRLFWYIIKFEDFDSDKVLLDEEQYGNILVYNFLHKTLIGAKPLRIRFDKIYGFIRVYDGTRYTVLFGPEKHNDIFNRIRYLIGVKSDIMYAFSHNYARFKVDWYDSLPVEKKFTFHDVIIHIKSVLIKGLNLYYYNIFLESSYELAKT